MDKLEELLTYLSENFHPHDIEDISEKIGVEVDKLRVMINFLVKYDFIQYHSGKLKIDSELREIYLYSQSS
ncbi:MAG: hypothetical protein ACLFVP_09525 [Candidatus Bathyarchaeia archaeon]